MIRLILQIRHLNDVCTQSSHRIRQIISKYSNKFRRVNTHRHGHILIEKLIWFHWNLLWMDRTEFIAWCFSSNVLFKYCARAVQLFLHFIRKHFLVFFASSSFYWTCQILTLDIFPMDYNNLEHCFREFHRAAASHSSTSLWGAVHG